MTRKNAGGRAANGIARFVLLAATGAALLSAETQADRSWSILNKGLTDQKVDRRVKAVRALGLIVNNQKARELAEKALADPKPDVREAAADSLGADERKSVRAQTRRSGQDGQGYGRSVCGGQRPLHPRRPADL